MDAVKHTPVRINNVNVYFPHQPYETQIDYMSSVITSLNNGTNAILESPTGTGKTIALLCSSLAWLQSSMSKTTIYYTSRTHSQLAQVAKELKRSAYARVPSVVVGSRAQTCLNNEVRQQGPEHLINRACRNAIAKNACQFYSNYEQKLETLDTNQVHDIESLGNWGRKHQCCPFYASKVLAESKASMNILPYNYLFDSAITKSLQLKLDNSVIIIDEAHNIDAVLKDAVSGQFSQNCLKTVQESCRELPSKVSEALNREKHGLTRFGFQPGGRRPQSAIVDEFSKKGDGKKTKEPKEPKPNLIEELAEKLTTEKLQQVNKCALILEQETRSNVEMEKIQTIDKIMKLLRSAGIEYRTSNMLIETLESMTSFYSVAGIMNPIQVAKKVSAISNLNNFISLLYPKEYLNLTKQMEHEKNLNEYYVAYCEGVYVKGQVVQDYKCELKDWTLNIWCLNPAIGLRRVIDSHSIKGPRSVILTSGTLAPTLPIAKELGVDFKIQRQFKHVISEDQFKVMIIGQSADSYSLKSDFSSTNEDSYKRAIGKTLLSLFKILPYGTLVFFSSYVLMKKVLNYLEKNKILSDMKAVTNIFIESQLQDSFSSDMSNYKRILDIPNSRAVFFGVCRGKLSEGVNLSDNQCRTVIMTGLPFPNSQDPKVTATRTFQERKFRDTGGKLWYVQQMTRALNQTVGRVIRSRTDHGMLLLCDPRFKNYKYELSEWTRPYVPSGETDFGDLEAEIKSFFEKHGHNITGSVSETVGAFEIGFNKSTKSTTSSKDANGNQSNSKTNDNTLQNQARFMVNGDTNRNHVETILNDCVNQNHIDSTTHHDQSQQAAKPKSLRETMLAQYKGKERVLKKRPVEAPADDSGKRMKRPATIDMNYSILDQLLDTCRPSEYKCCICLNQAQEPHKTNCKCSRVACLRHMKALHNVVCGECKVFQQIQKFKPCLFKSAFHKREKPKSNPFSTKRRSDSQRGSE